MDTPTPLFTAALAAVSITARYEYPDGWIVTFQCRREGETWTDSAKSRYDSLTTGEAIDVVEAHVAILRDSEIGSDGTWNPRPT